MKSFIIKIGTKFLFFLKGDFNLGKIKVLKSGVWRDIQPKVFKNNSWNKCSGYMLKNGKWIKITEERYEALFRCTWSSSYNESGNMRTDNKHIYQGDYHGINPYSTRGNLCGLMGFNYNDIKSKLQGATIESVSIELYNKHWYWSAGGTVNIGTHNKASKPKTYKPSSDSSKKIGVKQQAFSRYERKWVSLPKSVIQDFLDDKAKGIILWINSSNMLYYGYFAGYGESYAPTLKVVYYR